MADIINNEEANVASSSNKTENILLEVKGEVLGTQVTGIYKREKQPKEIKIGEVSCELVRGQFLVYGEKDPKANAKTIDEFVKGVQEQFSSKTKKEDIGNWWI
ncbi:MAG: hypothetical protein JKY48_15550 [Flavobacteriales bacterium]|nr:hypothetical protein [Flavobacteriales bacterium]